MSHIAIDARIISSSTGRYVERLIHYLEKIDTINTYSILVRKKDFNFYTPSNPNFHVVEADFADYSISEQIGFLKLLNNLQADLVHFCMPQQPVLYKGKHVTTIHDFTLLKTYNSDKNWFVFHAKQIVGRFVFKRVIKTSEVIFVPTKNTAKELDRFAPRGSKKTMVTYESADKVFSGKSTPHKLPFHDFILYVGQQSDYKNVKRLGDAHQKLLEKHPDLGLVLAGKLNASAKKNKDYFESKDYKNIHFTDFVPDSELAWLYRNTKAYVFPSLMEGFGLPGLEAMIYNAPVVSSNASCLPEVYGVAAHYFDPYNAGDMAKAIDEVLTNKNLRSKLVRNGTHQVKKYSWERMAKETLDGYNQALAKN